MNPTDEAEGPIGERLVRLEVQVANVQGNVAEIRSDVREIKAAQAAEHLPLTRAEKIAIAVSGCAVVSTVVAVITLLSGGGP